MPRKKKKTVKELWGVLRQAVLDGTFNEKNKSVVCDVSIKVWTSVSAFEVSRWWCALVSDGKLSPPNPS